jgi:hypothetical protein
MSHALPFDFVRSEASPALEPGFSGVVIRVDARSSLGQMRRLMLHGAYQVSVDTAREIKSIPLQKAVVVTVTSGLSFWSFNAVGEGFAFEDDEHAGGGVVRGYFNVDLLDRAGVGTYGSGFVLVSMGALLSNVVEVAAT